MTNIELTPKSRRQKLKSGHQALLPAVHPSIPNHYSKFPCSLRNQSIPGVSPNAGRTNAWAPEHLGHFVPRPGRPEPTRPPAWPFLWSLFVPLSRASLRGPSFWLRPGRQRSPRLRLYTWRVCTGYTPPIQPLLSTRCPERAGEEKVCATRGRGPRLPSGAEPPASPKTTDYFVSFADRISIRSF